MRRRRPQRRPGRPPRAIPTDQGVASRRQRGAFVESWWAERWVGGLERLITLVRLLRGRSCARAGQVLSLFEQTGPVLAEVQGSRRTPYRVRIGLAPLSDKAWERVITALSPPRPRRQPPRRRDAARGTPSMAGAVDLSQLLYRHGGVPHDGGDHSDDPDHSPLWMQVEIGTSWSGAWPLASETRQPPTPIHHAFEDCDRDKGDEAVLWHGRGDHRPLAPCPTWLPEATPAPLRAAPHEEHRSRSSVGCSSRPHVTRRGSHSRSWISPDVIVSSYPSCIGLIR
jgi:hypothetical protein